MGPKPGPDRLAVLPDGVAARRNWDDQRSQRRVRRVPVQPALLLRAVDLHLRVLAWPGLCRRGWVVVLGVLPACVDDEREFHDIGVVDGFEFRQWEHRHLPAYQWRVK